MAEDLKFDNLDLDILNILVTDAKVPFSEIGKKLNVSGATIHVRMKKLQQMGVVTGSQMKVNYGRLGYDITAFLGIYLERSALYNYVLEKLERVQEIESAHYTTGSYGIFAKVICRDTQHLREVLHDKIQSIKGVQRTETFISLEESFHRPVLLNHQ